MPSAFTPPPVELDVAWPEKYELIDGERIQKGPKSHRRVVGIMLLVEWLGKIFPKYSVGQHMPIHLPPNSEPDADAVVLSKPFNELTAIPKANEIRLVAEVSDTTLAFDLTAKAALYARAEIPEYWVLDVTNRRLIVHRSPQNGSYQDVKAYADSESLAPLAAPDALVAISTFF